MIARRFEEFIPGQGRTPPTLTQEQDVERARDDEYVVLARGCHSEDQRNAIVENETASGSPGPESGASRPTKAQAIAYVQFESAVGPAQSPAHELARREYGLKLGVVEWTSSTDIAIQFGLTRGGIVVARIKKQYLTKGSGTREQGWLALLKAPIDGLVYIKPKGSSASAGGQSPSPSSSAQPVGAPGHTSSSAPGGYPSLPPRSPAGAAPASKR